MYWKFTEIAVKEDLMFNPSLERFYKFKIDGVVRENIQNSLDAWNKESNQPVKVKIKLGEIDESELPEIDEIKKRIPYLKGANEYTKETIENMKEILKNKKVKYITFEDENTKGLKYSATEKDTWKAYAYKKGVHNIDEDNENEKNRGGSHGVGKIASNASSDLYLIYFCNCDDEGKKLIGGNIQLIEHDYNGKSYRSTGYFTENLEKEIPFENKYGGIFDKNTRGLKLVIPYYREKFGKENEIIKSICDNFFLAILNEKLVVEVNEKIISKDTIKAYIDDEKLFPRNLGVRSTEMTPLYFKTYTECEKQSITIDDRQGINYEFDLFFRYDESITKGRVAIIRSIGMKIEDFKVDSCATKPFNAVLIPSNSNCDMFLKSLENESHTELSYKHFKKKELENNAKKFISNLNKKMKEILNEYLERNNQSDGEIETDDLIYTIENQFKKVVNEKYSLYDIGSSKIIKSKIERRKRTEKEKENEYVPKKVENRRDRKPRKLNENKKARKNETYEVIPQIVKRIVLKEKEILEIDLKNSKNLKNGDELDLRLTIIDGMGMEYDYDIEKNYIGVVDLGDGKVKSLDENKIKDIVIKNKKIKLEFNLNKKVNRALKFRYYMEV